MAKAQISGSGFTFYPETEGVFECYVCHEMPVQIFNFLNSPYSEEWICPDCLAQRLAANEVTFIDSANNIYGRPVESSAAGLRCTNCSTSIEEGESVACASCGDHEDCYDCVDHSECNLYCVECGDGVRQYCANHMECPECGDPAFVGCAPHLEVPCRECGEIFHPGEQSCGCLPVTAAAADGFEINDDGGIEIEGYEVRF